MPKSISKHRLATYKRQQGRCYYCGLPMWLKSADELAKGLGVKARTIKGLQCTAEHLVARQDGGDNSTENIVAACRTCNGCRHRKAVPLSPWEHRERVQARLRAGKWHPQALVRLVEVLVPRNLC